jgi:carbon-monoxide dehydrogenase medium subunit
MLARHGDQAKVLAGGQSLLLMVHLGLVRPGVLVGLQRLSDLAGIVYDPSGSLRIGAMTTLRAIETSLLVRQHCPMLAHASSLIASVPVRTLGTLGGNLCHNLPGADPPPGLIALDAVVSLASARGNRELAVVDLFRGFLETCVEPDELLTHIRIPAIAPRSRAVYLRDCVRAVDPALVGVAVRLALADDGVTCTDICIGVGGVSYRPYRATSAENVLRGERLNPDSIAAAAQIAATECDPLADAHGSARYRRKMLEVFLRRAVTAAWHGDHAFVHGELRFQ